MKKKIVRPTTQAIEKRNNSTPPHCPINGMGLQNDQLCDSANKK